MFESVLLLNASFEPLRVISWKRAVSLFFAGKVEVIEEYENRIIRAVSISLQAPCVVRLLDYVRIRPLTPRVSRENVWRRDKGKCQYCGVDLRLSESTVDHVLPRSRAGGTVWQNLVCSCRTCNTKKSNKTPAEARMPLLSEPAIPHWLPFVHIESHERVPKRWEQFFVRKRKGRL